MGNFKKRTLFYTFYFTILAEIRKRFLCFRDLYSVKKSYQFRPQFP